MLKNLSSVSLFFKPYDLTFKRLYPFPEESMPLILVSSAYDCHSKLVFEGNYL